MTLASNVAAAEDIKPVKPAKSFKRAAKEDSLVTVFMMELVKVLDEDHLPAVWLLHDLRDASFRMFNAAMRACILVPHGTHPATHAYREISRSMEEYRSWNAAKYDETGEAHFERRSRLDVPSTMRAYVSNLACRAYMDKRKKIAKGEVSIPSFKKSGPIHVQKKDWTIDKDDKGIVVSVKLRGGTDPRTRFAVVPCGPSDYASVKILLDKAEGVDRCDLKLVFDDDRRKWFAKIAFRRPRPVATELDPKKRIAVHRGIRTFLTWACDAHVGVATQELHDGATFLRWKARMRRSGASLRKSMKHPGGASRGHGIRRRLRAYSAHEETHRRFVKTLCQQLAAKVVGIATKFGAGTLVIEDYSARDFADELAKTDPYFARIVRDFPLYTLRACMEGAAERAGIGVQIVPSFYESSTCPQCGNVDEAQDDKRGNFRCTKESCGLRRSVEAVAAWNMLRMAGDPEAFQKARQRLEERFGELLRASGQAMGDDSISKDMEIGEGGGGAAGGARKPPRKRAKGRKTS